MLMLRHRFFWLPLIALLLFATLTTLGRAEEPGPFPGVDMNDPASLREATRVLQEEIMLAGRHQNYLLIDLVTKTIHIKGRGLDLYRITIVSWAFEAPEAADRTFRLMARPPIIRPTIDPTVSPEPIPLSLDHMPTTYTLSFAPPLTIEVRPSDEGNLFRRLDASLATSWRTLKKWVRSFAVRSLAGGTSTEPAPYLLLEIPHDQAKSLAWSAVDGMPLVIRRPTEK
jgi:hypothetical protein